jgi:hypothetical protein
VTQLRFGVGTPTLTASSAEQTRLGNQTYCWSTFGREDTDYRCCRRAEPRNDNETHSL